MNPKNNPGHKKVDHPALHEGIIIDRKMIDGEVTYLVCTKARTHVWVRHADVVEIFQPKSMPMLSRNEDRAQFLKSTLQGDLPRVSFW